MGDNKNFLLKIWKRTRMSTPIQHNSTCPHQANETRKTKCGMLNWQAVTKMYGRWCSPSRRKSPKIHTAIIINNWAHQLALIIVSIAKWNWNYKNAGIILIKWVKIIDKNWGKRTQKYKDNHVHENKSCVYSLKEQILV